MDGIQLHHFTKAGAAKLKPMHGIQPFVVCNGSITDSINNEVHAQNYKSKQN